MEIGVVLDGNRLILSPKGVLDSNTGDGLAKALDENVTDDICVIEFDMTDVDYISSKGLRIITAAYKDIKERGSVRVSNCNRAVHEIFTISGLDKKFISVGD